MLKRIGRALGMVFSEDEQQCQYTDPDHGRCEIIVPPGQGARYAHAAFCSEEHAALDQEEQAF